MTNFLKLSSIVAIIVLLILSALTASSQDSQFYKFTIYPNKHTIMFDGRSYVNSDIAKQLDIPAGTYEISANFHRAHAGGDIDGVFFVKWDDRTSIWPNGHAHYFVITTHAQTIYSPNKIYGYLFFADGGDYSDNSGSVDVIFRRLQ